MKLLLVASFLVCFHNRNVDSSQRDVYASIFEGYQKDLRPVHNDSTEMILGIQLQIISLLEVNAEQEYIKAAVYISQLWKDEYLVWDPSNFSGTTLIKVPASVVWLPNVAVVSASLEPEYFMPTEDRMVSIFSDGTVYSSFPFVLTNYCKMQIEEYPFDTQECFIKIGSWAYMKEQLNLQHTLIDDDTSMPQNNSTVWDILPYMAETYELPSIPGQTFMQLWYRQKMKRKPTYYIWVLIAPTFIITALSLAGLYAPFNNSGDREEKVTLGLTTLLTLAVILSMVTGEMPRGSSLPLLGLFVLIEIIMIVVSMALSVATMFLHQRATTRQWAVPSWLMSILFCHQAKSGKITDEHGIILETPRCDNGELDMPHYAKSQSTSDEATLLQACLRQLNATYTKVNGWQNKKEEEKTQEHHWLLVFDRLDVTLFLSFQVIHLVAFIFIFYPHYGALH